MYLAAWLLHALAALVLCALACKDFQRRRLPNKLVLAYLLLFIPYAALFLPWAAIESRLLFAGAAFLFGLLFYALGAWGAGDVKLVAVLFMWAAPADLPAVIVVVGVGGGLLAVAALALGVLERRLRARWRASNTGSRTLAARAARCLCLALAARRGVPYGAALAAGGLLAHWRQMQAFGVG